MTSSLIEYLNSLNIKWGYTENPIPPSYIKYQKWVEDGQHGNLNYLADERMEKRKSIENVFPSFNSALVFAFPFLDAIKKLENIYESRKWNGHKIAPYSFAFGAYDYHQFLTDSLNEVIVGIKRLDPDFDFMISIDTLPVLERDLAHRAGIGVFGSNTMLMNEEYGSNFIIASILFSKKLDLPENSKLDGDCGNCSKCKSYCPTEAIHVGMNCINCPVCMPKCPPAAKVKSIDAGKCLSAYTVEEFKDVEPPKGYHDSSYIFGCNMCQDICPWNENLKFETSDNELSEHEKFIANFFLLRPVSKIIAELNELSNRGYRKLFKGTAFERTGRVGMLKNFTNRS